MAGGSQRFGIRHMLTLKKLYMVYGGLFRIDRMKRYILSPRKNNCIDVHAVVFTFIDVDHRSKLVDYKRKHFTILKMAVATVVPVTWSSLRN